jgi:hypothetical protein
MPRHSPQPHPDPASVERLGGFLNGRNGQTLAGTPEVTPHQPSIATPVRPEELQRLLGASIDENWHLTAHVRRLEAEVRRSSAELPSCAGSCVVPSRTR